MIPVSNSNLSAEFIPQLIEQLLIAFSTNSYIPDIISVAIACAHRNSDTSWRLVSSLAAAQRDVGSRYLKVGDYTCYCQFSQRMGP